MEKLVFTAPHPTNGFILMSYVVQFFKRINNGAATIYCNYNDAFRMVYVYAIGTKNTQLIKAGVSRCNCRIKFKIG